jgi:6-pyruvoyltetrahydropterin/6-carboxytetrahydropterin synthase
MFVIKKKFEFSAAHRLLDLPKGHRCGRLHGHNYIVEVEFFAEDLDPRGFAGHDFTEFAPIRKFLEETFDHRTILRDDDPLVGAIHSSEGEGSGVVITVEGNPTAEYLAVAIYHSMTMLGFANVAAVCVSETPGTWAEARMELE